MNLNLLCWRLHIAEHQTGSRQNCDPADQVLLKLHEADAWLAGRLFAAMSNAGGSGIALQSLVCTLASCVKVGQWPSVVLYPGTTPACST